MKKWVIVFLLLTMAFFSKAQERKKVGLVLSGGGAKGMAHIGAIKVLEEAGIPIDYIVGTSMGALVGGLYAIGYDTHTLDSLVRVQDWSFLLSDKVSRNALSFLEKESDEKYLLSVPVGKRENRGAPGFIHGQNIYNLFSDLTIGYHDSLNFNNLPIPFACVSANIVDGSEVVMHSGNLVMAMRASMAIPGVFTPVRKDSLLLVDGGIINNFPVDIAKRIGADIVVGIDVQSDLKNAEELNSLTGVIGQLINLLCLNKYEENRKLVDLYIHPNIEGYSAGSFNLPAIDTLIRRGEEETRLHWNDIIALKNKVGIEKVPDYSDYYEPKDSFYIREIIINGVSEDEKNRLRRSLKIKENSTITPQQIENTVARLYGTGGFREVTYRLTGESEYVLELNLEEKNTSTLNFGFRFDTEEMAAILINIRFRWRAFVGSRFSLTARLSKSPYFQMDYSFENPLLSKVGLSYRFKYNDFNLYEKGEKINAVTYRHHLADLNLNNIFVRNFKFQVGLRYEYFDYDAFLYKSETESMNVKSEGLISYYGLAHLETFDKRYYPNRGLSFKASYSLHTDNFTTYEGGTPFSALSADFTGVISITRRFKILPSIYGRTLIGSNISFPYMNYMGGEMPGHYMIQQIPFAGIGNIELFDKSIVVGKIQLRQRMGNRHYVSLGVNYAMQDDNFFDILGNQGIWGGNAMYAYDLPIGPVEVNFSLSDWSKDFRFYFNLGFNF